MWLKQKYIIVLLMDKLLLEGMLSLKIKLVVSDGKYTEIATKLLKNGFEIDEEADFILSERNVYARYIIGKKNDELFRMRTEEISHIESFAHDVVAHLNGDKFKITERLCRLEQILDPKNFIRISNSIIASANHIKSIKPVISQKFILTLTDGSKVDVTRTYYYVFKEFLGI